MRSLSITEAAFAGFRFVRENPRIVGVWAAISLVLSLVGGFVMVQTVGPQIMQMQALSAGVSDDPVQTLALLKQLAPFYTVAVLFACVYYPALYAAMNRALLRPGDDRHAYLRLGADEVRQFLLFLLSAAVAIGAYIALILGVMAVVLVAGMILGKGPIAGVAGGVLVFAALCGLLFGYVRLSLASPLTFDTRKVNLFGSWRLTRGQFWRIFGCYLLVTCLMAVVLVLILIILAAVAAVTGGLGGLAQLAKPDMSSAAAYYTPTQLALTVLGALASAVIFPVAMMPMVDIYDQLADAP